MNRRDFLLSTTGLALAPSAVLGQASTASAPASGDTVFADFESESYDGWTLEGNCWTPEPYSDKHFPGKITGFQGKRVLCTLHPRFAARLRARRSRTMVAQLSMQPRVAIYTNPCRCSTFRRRCRAARHLGGVAAGE